jgi:hypothetical protein
MDGRIWSREVLGGDLLDDELPRENDRLLFAVVVRFCFDICSFELTDS